MSEVIRSTVVVQRLVSQAIPYDWHSHRKGTLPEERDYAHSLLTQALDTPDQASHLSCLCAVYETLQPP